jgi:thiamine biosynthesis lipoprotein
VDVALLDARLAAELGDEAAAGAGAVGIAGTSGAAANPGGVRAAGRGAWSLTVGRHRSGVVARPPGLRFDLDGVGKGWIADRALAVLGPAGAIVDADGDIAVRAAPGDAWEVAVGDPRDDTRALAVLALPGGPFGRSFGVASSGTSVHHWGPAGARRHHLIDPATGAPARTDVVQATVIATTAREAEAYAKAIVIRGAAAGLDLVERSGAGGAIVLLEDGRTVALPRTTRYLA